jgi:hypothetical protein
LACEPQRIAKRYFKHDARFIGLILMHVLVESNE